MEPYSVAHLVPVEVVAMIIQWITEFHRVDALLRAREFKATQSLAWGIIMSDVRANTPRYTVRLSFDSSEVELDISLYLPDCDIWRLGARRDLPPAAIESARRRALSMG